MAGSSPSTQDSPKVPGLLTADVCGNCGSQNIAESNEENARCGDCGEWMNTEQLQAIPVSALLSDEVVEAVCRFRWERIWSSTWDEATASREALDVRGVARMREATRADLQVAIEQVGGGQGA